MVKVWKNKEELIEKGVDHDMDISIGNAMNEPASKYVHSVQRYCPGFNAESFSKKKSISITTIKAYRLILDTLPKLPSEFSHNEYKDHFPFLIGLTNWSLFRDVLSVLVCEGKLNKKIIKKQKGISYIYSQNRIINPCKYYQSFKCQCDFDIYGSKRDDFKVVE